MEYDYSPEQQGFINYSISNMSVRIRDALPFYCESEFSRVMRMPILQFLNLVTLLHDHECFGTWSYSDVVLQIAVCIHRLGNGGLAHRTAAIFGISSKNVNEYTCRVIDIIIDRLANSVAFPKTACDPDGPFDGKFDTRVGFLGAGSVWLGLEPAYLEPSFCSYDKSVYGKYSIRIMAAIAPSLKFMYFLSDHAGATPFERIMELSPLVQQPGKFLTGCQYLLADNAPKKSRNLFTPYLEDQYIHELAEQAETTPRHRSATFAVNRAFWMWKCIFRSLNALPICIVNERAMAIAKKWINATAYLYNFLHPNLAYVQWLDWLDKDASLREVQAMK